MATTSKTSPPTTVTDPMKTRIITHMNADHQRSLALYLRHYCRIPTSHARTAQLTDMTPTHMILTSTFGRSYIPITPPMASLSEARPRVVAMHQECLRALDLSDTLLTTWTPPRGLHLFIFILCTWIFTSFSYANNFSPTPHPNGRITTINSYFYAIWSLNHTFPSLPAFCHLIQPYLLTFMVVAHSGEASWLAYSRLRKHGVEMFSRLWWTWVLDCFVEGFGCFERVDAIVKEKEDAKKGDKH